MRGKKIQLTENTLKKIAECLFLAFTAEQAAAIAGLHRNTLLKLRQTEQWAKVQQWALQLEIPYRKRVWKGEPGWQGAAWMLERKYAAQLAKPELQLQVNASSQQTTNNVLIVSAERAASLTSRASSMEGELNKLLAAKQPGQQLRSVEPELQKLRSAEPESQLLAAKEVQASIVNQPAAKSAAGKLVSAGSKSKASLKAKVS